MLYEVVYMQGPKQPALKISKQEKQKFIETIAKEFYQSPASTSQSFIVELKNKYQHDSQMHNLLTHLTADGKDDLYGIMTLTLEHSPSNIEFRLKRPEPYGGPKTENYLERIDLKIEAARQWINQHPMMDESAKKEKLDYLDDLSTYFKRKIKSDCHLDSTILRNLSVENETSSNHFNQQHRKAKKHLALFMSMLIEEINIEVKNPNSIKKQLYSIEQDLMSKERPERISVRQIAFDNTKYIEINSTTPVDKEKTISSAKKTTTGVANWLNTTTQIYSQDFKLLDTRESYRSASIIPHDIINRGGKKLNQNYFSNRLAKETAKRNMLEHVIPQLVRDKKEKYNEKGEALPAVLELDYEMLTLLSPISKIVDRVADPDFTQFIGIRDAFNHYQDRVLNVVVDETPYQVKFNGIYHNYGTNPGRGWSTAEERVNKKAFNQLIDRSIVTINQNHDASLQPLKDLIIKDLPTFTASEKAIISNNQVSLTKIYAEMDKNNKALTKDEHKTLLDLHAKKLKKQPLNAIDEAEYARLRSVFENIQKKNAGLKKNATRLESQISSQHVELHQRRELHLSAQAMQIEEMLSNIESNANYPKKSEEYRKTVEHIRALHEYAKLSLAGYDSALGIILPFATTEEKRNEKNYAIQSYIALINRFNNITFHKTCKSGKDRTNSAEEKEKAKNLVRLHECKVPSFEGNAEKEDALFCQGFLHGPGNDICGDNMKPGAQQVSQDDIPTKVNIKIVKSMASLQKGIDSLSPASPTEREDVIIDFAEYRRQKLSPPAEATGSPFVGYRIEGIPSPIEATDSRIETTSSPLEAKNTSAVNRTAKPKIVSPLFIQQYNMSARLEEAANAQEVMHTAGNNIDGLVKHLKENHEKCNYGGEPEITPLIRENMPKAMSVRLKIPPPDGTKFYASDNSKQDGINYSVPKKNKMEESTLQHVCRVAVDMAKEDTEFDLSRTPLEIQEKMYQFLDKYINERFTQNEKPSIVGYTPVKKEDAARLMS